jgi:hypothetical protein
MEGWGWGGFNAMPCLFTPRKETWYPLHRKLCGPQGQPGCVRKISPSLGFNLQTLEPIESHYTDYAIPFHINDTVSKFTGLSQWPRSLRRGSTAARLLGLWVRIPPGAWMSVSCRCCVLSGRGLCDGLVTRPEENYRVWCI